MCIDEFVNSTPLTKLAKNMTPSKYAAYTIFRLARCTYRITLVSSPQTHAVAVLVDVSNKWTNMKLDPVVLLQLHTHSHVPAVLILNKVCPYLPGLSLNSSTYLHVNALRQTYVLSTFQLHSFPRCKPMLNVTIWRGINRIQNE